jgi:hypothetical protein
MRCTRFNYVCEGYAPAKLRRTRVRADLVVIAPLKPARLAKPAKPASLLLTRLHQEPSSPLFKSEDENRYFRYFCETTVSRLEGHYDPNLWHQLILQTCVRDSPIRQIVIAVAALDITSISSSSCSEVTKNEDHHQFALKHYSIAIQEMRANVSNGKQDLRTTLILSILVACFEAYHGNYESALAQVYTGQELIAGWTATQRKLSDGGFLSPSPSTIDDEIFRAFHTLEVQAITHTDYLPLHRHIELKNYGLSTLEKMPKEFSTLREAQLYGKLVMRRIVHFLAMSWTYDAGNSAAPDTSFSLLDRVSNCSNAEAYAEQSKYLNELHRWHTAFLPVYQKIRKEPTGKEFFGATCLQIHFLISYIGTVSALASHETSYDSMLPIFAETVSLAKGIFEDNEECKFTYAFRAIFAMDMVAKKCRDPTIRRGAISLLMSRPRRELFWDSIIAGKVCSWVVEVEEEGMVGGYVSEESRVRAIGVKIGGGEVHVWCKQPKNICKETGAQLLRETIIQV